MKPENRSLKNAEVIVSLVLQIGVTLSSVIIFIGIVIFFARHNSVSASFLGANYRHYTAASYGFPHNVSSIKAALEAGSGIGYITLGVLLLILTPVLRVATSILLFVRQKDKPMTMVTLFVLLVLAASFYLGMVVR